MRRIKQAKPSAGLIVAVVALVAALGGGAVAGVAVTSLNKKDKKQVTKIAKKQAKKQSSKAVAGIPAGPKGDPGPEGATGDTGDKGDKGDKGDPGATSVLVRESGTKTVAADGSDSFIQGCQPGEVATGGGIRILQVDDGTEDVHIWNTAPDPSSNGGTPTGWRGGVKNADDDGSNTGDITYRVYAICASP
jgi:hypothetical protein